MKTRRENILDTVSDLASCFMYYDRKEDGDLPCGSIEEAIEAGEISHKEIIDKFTEVCDFNPTTQDKEDI